MIKIMVYGLCSSVNGKGCMDGTITYQIDITTLIHFAFSGVPLEDVFPVDTMITYYRFSNPAESLTYLAEAEIKTMVIYGDAASAEAAYNTIAVDPVAWGSQVGGIKNCCCSDA